MAFDAAFQSGAFQHLAFQDYYVSGGDSRELKRYNYPYTSKESTWNTGTFRTKNIAFGPYKTTF